MTTASSAATEASSAKTQPLCTSKGLHKSFDELEVLRGIDLTVAEHEVVCLIGASGSGKSTLLRCINLLEPIDAGRIWIEGDEITGRGVDVDRVRRRIGIVFQHYNLFPHMTVIRNVTLAPRKVPEAVRRCRRTRERWSCSPASGWPTNATNTPTDFPAASSNAPRSSAHWP